MEIITGSECLGEPMQFTLITDRRRLSPREYSDGTQSKPNPSAHLPCKFKSQCHDLKDTAARMLYSHLFYSSLLKNMYLKHWEITQNTKAKYKNET